jgi:acetoin utilization deacetylase AcuC-like enzyme
MKVLCGFSGGKQKEGQMGQKKLGIVSHPDFFIHDNPSHPEKKERLQAILSLLRNENLLDSLVQLAPLPATVDEVASVHTKEHIANIQRLCQSGRTGVDADTYLVPESYQVGLLSVGAALTAMRSVMRGTLDVCFSLGRPPGHHAEPNRGMGFCLFNNIAVAARQAREEFGVKRILILDWDVHHGNSTQKVFYHDPGVLFISVHQSPAFPGSGHIGETGAGEGVGFNVNIPLPPGCGDPEYNQVFEEIVRPLADRYQPELVMVSAGQDTYHNDPLASMRLSYRGFAEQARHVREIADQYAGGKIILTLEGGYHLRGQAEAVATVLSVLGGWERPVNSELAPSSDPYYDDPGRIIAEVKQLHFL